MLMLEQVSEAIVPDVPKVPVITQIHVSHIESKGTPIPFHDAKHAEQLTG